MSQEPRIDSRMGATVRDFGPWQEARNEVYRDT